MLGVEGYYMLGNKEYRVVVDGKEITITTGGFASQAGGAVTVQQGNTLLLATATMSHKAREGMSFFPLTVDYEERLYAGGRIPGSFFRREGRPSEAAILIARLTDRPIRPLFPKDMRNDVQVILYSISSDGETPIDVLAILGASAALTISNVPFDGPVGAIRVGRNADGQFIYNSTYQETASSDLDLRIAGTKDAILMVECGAQQVEEAVLVDALQAGHEAMQPLIELQLQMQQEFGKPKSDYEPFAWQEGLEDTVQQQFGTRIAEVFSQPHSKESFDDAVRNLQEVVVSEFAAEGELTETEIIDALSDQIKLEVRNKILDDSYRPDGRGLNEIRELRSMVDLSPRAHGSGLFQRGETQVLTLATLGTPRERQELDNLAPTDEKRYMHHYNFPPFSTGETKPLRGASRREIGHGALAERALLPVLPSIEEFPYTMRLVSEVLSSNGSTSMASVCGSTLALMDTGVPISAPVAGIAMGLVKDGARFAVLTDIQGIEDYLGDMDFKVAGTKVGVTALQMDIKIKGITPEIMSQALAQAKEARLKVLENIQSCLPEPRGELKSHAPRMTVIKIDPEKIGAVIGPGGRNIRGIQDETGARVDIEDDGTIFIASSDGPSADSARERIESMVEEAVVGRIYTGRVVRVTDFGAFVEILPNTDGLVHISQLASEHIQRVEDVANVGDEITVMVTDIDPEGKIRLSRQAVLEGWTPEEARERDQKKRRGGGSGGSHSRNRRPRRSDSRN
jgi:polyribonucleotide nucleotidyltransferase